MDNFFSVYAVTYILLPDEELSVNKQFFLTFHLNQGNKTTKIKKFIDY